MPSLLASLTTVAGSGSDSCLPCSVAQTFISVPTVCLAISAEKLPSLSIVTFDGVKSVLPSSEVILTVAPGLTLPVTVVVSFGSFVTFPSTTLFWLSALTSVGLADCSSSSAMPFPSLSTLTNTGVLGDSSLSLAFAVTKSFVFSGSALLSFDTLIVNVPSAPTVTVAGSVVISLPSSS